MTNLGALPGDICSYAFQISPKDQVTGASDNDCAGGNSHGFLWENGGPMADLNDLVTAADMTLIQPTAINDAGEITGLGVLANGDLHAFLLIPCDDDHPDIEGCDYSMLDAEDVVNNAVARQTPRVIPPTFDSLPRTINPSQNWFKQRYRILGQRPPLSH